MSLKKPESAVQDNAPFEAEYTVTHEEVQQSPQEEAPAKAQTFSVVSASKMGNDPFTDKQNAFAKMGVVVPYATFKQITIANGDMVVSGQASEKLGRKAKMKLLNWNRKWMVTAVNDPNKGGEAARKLIKWSLDGKTTDDGLDIATYVQSLINDGFEQAKCSERMEITAQVVDSETGGLVGEVVVLSCAKSSVNNWNAFLVKTMIACMTKPANEDADALFEAKVTSITSKGNTWGAFGFDLV